MDENLKPRTPKQVEVYANLTRIQQSKKMFYWLLCVFTLLLSTIIVMVFKEIDIKIILPLIGVDGVIGWSIKYVVAYIFSPPIATLTQKNNQVNEVPVGIGQKSLPAPIDE